MGDITENLDIKPTSWTPVEEMIKVIGVGGAGCNAVNYMYREKVQGCGFIVCNTDNMALRDSPVPVKIHIGENYLGAGTDPEKGRNAALEAQDEIKKIVIDSSTQMLFITAGMGGGTGTGAAPVIAKMAKDAGILTVAVVTIPFENEGQKALARAIDGINELTKNVDSLLIINNEKLYSFFGDLLMHKAFPKADEVVTTAVRGIVEIISQPGYINVDFEDVKTMMKDSGMALMGSGEGRGENRIEDAVEGALNSPLLNDFNLSTAKNLLVNITSGRNEKGLKMADLDAINKRIAEYTGNANKFKSGLVWLDDPEIGDKLRITVIATGFRTSDLKRISKVNLGNIIQIGKDFRYEKENGIVIEDQNPFQNEGEGVVIGFSSAQNVKHFKIDKDKVPALIKAPGESLSELESIPAIRRRSETNSERID